MKLIYHFMSNNKMESVGILYFENLVKEWASTSDKLEKLEMALVERSKLDSSMSDEDKLDLVRDLRYLAMYLSGLKYNNSKSTSVTIRIEIYGLHVTGYAVYTTGRTGYIVENPFYISNLNIKDLTSNLIQIETQNKYSITALSSLLWDFTYGSWDPEFVNWIHKESKISARLEITTNIEYANDYKITPPVSYIDKEPNLVPLDKRCSYVFVQGLKKGQHCNRKKVAYGYCNFCLKKNMVQVRLGRNFQVHKVIQKID